MDIINEYLKKNSVEERTSYGTFYGVTPRILCNDGYNVSVQAREFAYCTPRKNAAWPYERVELGYPSEPDVLINDYAECPEYTDYTDTVYPYVPIDIVVKLIEKHGGIKG